MTVRSVLGYLALIPIVAGSHPSWAHEVRHSIVQSAATIIQLHYPDGRPFAFEGFEIYRAKEKIPYVVGRTDAKGKIAFLPDSTGTWRVKAFSDDGHGVDLTFETDAQSAVMVQDRSFYERHARILVGIGLILGLFGLISLLTRGGANT